MIASAYKKNALSVVPAPDFNADEVIIHAASLLNQITHPCAVAITALARQQHINLLSAVHVESHNEQGWTGRVNGKICVLGKKDLMTQAHIDTSALLSEISNLVDGGQEVYFLSIGDHLAGIFGMPGSSHA